MFNHNENFTVFESNTTEAVVQAQGQENEIREEEGLDNEIIEEDIELFKQNESLEEGETQHVSKIDMQFQNADEAYKFYNQ